MAQEPPMIAPMLARTCEKLPAGAEYIYEIKLDGQRALASVSRRNLLLYTRTYQKITDKYPELANLFECLRCKSAVLDGEIVALQDGIPSFGLLQQRMNLRNSRLVTSLSNTIPVVYYIFDLLEKDGKSCRELPLLERRRKLQEILQPTDQVKLLPYFDSSEFILSKAEEFGYEGLMAKKRNSIYRPGQRTDDWVKYKFLQQATFLICGWTEGGRTGNFGALVMGKYHGRGKYAHIGQVGTGFSDRTIGMLMAKFQDLYVENCPFVSRPKISEKVHWLRPRLKAEIKFKEWTKAEILRAPVFVRLVLD